MKLSKKEILQGMIEEADNEITKSEIMARLHQRLSLEGHVQKNEQLQGMNNSKMKSLKITKEHLQFFLQEEIDKESKDEKVKKPTKA